MNAGKFILLINQKKTGVHALKHGLIQQKQHIINAKVYNIMKKLKSAY